MAMLLLYYEWFAGFAVLAMIIILFFAVSVQDFIKSRIALSFKLLVVLLMLSLAGFVLVFLLAVSYVLFETSFIYHIYNGDLMAHLSKAF